jgi:hypothetical protein
MHETNGTRPDEQFPAGPYLGRWESSYKYTSKYALFMRSVLPGLYTVEQSMNPPPPPPSLKSRDLKKKEPAVKGVPEKV